MSALDMKRKPTADIDPRESREAKRAREVRRRFEVTEGCEHILGELYPPLTEDGLTAIEVANYFDISRSSLRAITLTHGDELRDVGYTPGDNRRMSRFTRRAVLHIALMMRPATSQQANAIKERLGVQPPTTAVNPRRRLRDADHIDRCRRLIDSGVNLVIEVRDQDPDEVWNWLERQNRSDLQGLVATLAAMVPEDSRPLKWLAELERSKTTDAATVIHGDSSMAAIAARGLAMLIPPLPRALR